MAKIPKNCLTCKFMEFVDDELELLQCHHIKRERSIVEDTYICDNYEVNQKVIEDAKQGCW